MMAVISSGSSPLSVALLSRSSRVASVRNAAAASAAASVGELLLGFHSNSSSNGTSAYLGVTTPRAMSSAKSDAPPSRAKTRSSAASAVAVFVFGDGIRFASDADFSTRLVRTRGSGFVAREGGAAEGGAASGRFPVAPYLSPEASRTVGVDASSASASAATRVVVSELLFDRRAASSDVSLPILMRGSESCDGSVTSAAAAFAGGAARAASSSHGRFLFCDFFSPAAPRFVALVAAAGGSLGAGARRARADARVIASARRPADDRASIARASCVRF